MTKTKLRKWRTGRGWTQAEMAAQLGMFGVNPASTYQKIEIGKHWPDAQRLDAIVRITGGAVTVEDLHRARLDFLEQASHDRQPELAAASAQGECV